jgi:integrase
MPTWVKVAQDAWTAAAGVANGFVFHPVNRGGQAQDGGLSEKVVWQLLQEYGAAAGVPGIAPHDLRRYAECRTMQRILSRVPYSERPQMRASSMAPCLKFHCAKPPRGSLEAYVF